MRAEPVALADNFTKPAKIEIEIKEAPAATSSRAFHFKTKLFDVVLAKSFILSLMRISLSECHTYRQPIP
jgi:hypothetical protein